MLATIAVDQRPGAFCVLSGADDLAAMAEALIREDEGLTVVVPIEVARDRGYDPAFVAAWLTLRVHSSLEAVGLTAEVAKALTEVGIASNVIAAFHHDHLLVPIDQADSAINAIERLRALAHLNTSQHQLTDPGYVKECRRALEADGVLVLDDFFTAEALEWAIADAERHRDDVFYASSTHNVYLTPSDPALPADHPFNRQVISSKGLLADDQIPADSPLRAVYGSDEFRTFLCQVLGIEAIHPYADPLSSINVHFAGDGQELGWHFDNSSFAVTMLLQAPQEGGVFEYVPAVRDADAGDMAYDQVGRILDGDVEVKRLYFGPGALVLFQGRNAIHRVTPAKGPITRLLVVFAYNDQAGIRLSDSALETFYGRTT